MNKSVFELERYKYILNYYTYLKILKNSIIIDKFLSQRIISLKINSFK